MTDSYRVRGGIEKVSDDSTTGGELKQATKEFKELGTVDASFSRGQLYLLDKEVVFAQSINESTILNLIDNVFSKGPFNPLRTLGLYKPYESPLDEADQYSGSWRLPYSDIEAVSLLSKGNGYEIFLRPSGNPGYLYRIRNDQGTDYIGFRWLYSPNHDTAVQMAGELFDQANRYGRVKTFNPGGHFVGRTKEVEFPQGDSEYADKEPVQQTTTNSTETTANTRAASETASQTNESEVTDSFDWMDNSSGAFCVRNKTDNPVQLTVGCRTASAVTFTEEIALNPDEEATWEELPDEEFQIGIAGFDKVGRTFQPADVDNTLIATATEAGIEFAIEEETPFEETTETTPPRDSRAAQETEQSNCLGASAGETVSDEPNHETESERAKGGQGGPKLRVFGYGLAVLLLGLPASGIIIGAGFVTFGVFLLGTGLTLVGLFQALLSWLR